MRIVLALLYLAYVSSVIGADGTETNSFSSLFHPPALFLNDFGTYPSPLRFYDGRLVTNRVQWPERRKEIRARWEGIAGRWPPLIAEPRLEVLQTEQRENFSQKRIRVEVARGLLLEGWLLVPGGSGRFPAILIPFYEPETSIGRGKEFLDFGYQLTRRGFVTLSIGSPGSAREPVMPEASCQPLMFLAYSAANCWTALSHWPTVDPKRIGVLGHSYGGKWAMFASCLDERFACAVWCDPGIVFDESRPNVNYWEPWYLGADPAVTRKPGVPSEDNRRTGAYKELRQRGHDLHELHALMAPRPFLVSGGSEDPPARWQALNHAVAVNGLLGYTNRVAMSNRTHHQPTAESNAQIYQFLEAVMRPEPGRVAP